MKKAAIILSGCGFLDGSEIYESVCTFLALEKCGVPYQCYAPNVEAYITNYITKTKTEEKRNILQEAARLARGNCKDLQEVDPDEYDVLILPGGFGAVANLSNFAEKGTNFDINPDVKKITEHFKTKKKPVGFICIAPVIAAKLYGPSLHCTIGNDKTTAKAIEAMGATHEARTVDDIVIDKKNKVVTTPAFMLGKSIRDVFGGITKLVEALLELA